MRSWTPIRFLALLVVVIAGCGVQSKTPIEFQTAAENFRTMKGTNRVFEAEKLLGVLPKCPVTFSNDTGISRFRAYDYSRPSFRLTKDQIVAALGQPHSIHEDPVYSISYDVGTNGLGHWFLSIEMRGGYAVNCLLHAWPPE